VGAAPRTKSSVEEQKGASFPEVEEANMKRFPLVVALFATAASASASSALTVTCSDCVAFQGIEVSLDGKTISSGPARNVETKVAPGKHKVRVTKVVGKAREELPPLTLKFKKGSTLRLNARLSELQVYGTEKLTVKQPAKRKARSHRAPRPRTSNLESRT
jgi:hypothetical protein